MKDVEDDSVLSLAQVDVTNADDHTYLCTGVGLGSAMSRDGAMGNPVIAFSAIDPKFLIETDDGSDDVVWGDEARKPENTIDVMIVFPTKEAIGQFAGQLLSNILTPGLSKQVKDMLNDYEHNIE